MNTAWKPAIVTESAPDARFLRWALGEAAERAAFYVGGGKSAADSLGRSIVIRDRRPTAVVLDADQVDPEEVASERDFYEYSLASVAARTPTLLLLAVPTLEAVAFADPDLLERVAGRKLGEPERIRAEYDARKALDDLLGGDRVRPPLDRFVDAAAAFDPAPVQRHDLIRRLRDFVRAPAGAVAGATAPIASSR